MANDEAEQRIKYICRASDSQDLERPTSKWQITIPEAVRKELPFKVGQRIIWEAQGDKIVGRRVRSVSELAGCLKSDAIAPGGKAGEESAKAAMARHERISRQKS